MEVSNAAIIAVDSAGNYKRKRIVFVSTEQEVRPTVHQVNKSNFLFNSDSFMEVKSLDSFQRKRPVNVVAPTKCTAVEENPYEVIRKPPKKKKKHDIQDQCFENPALNLSGPEEMPINPYEVPRQPIVPVSEVKCFANEALNVRGPDYITKPCNPFEITRKEPCVLKVESQSMPNNEITGIENPCLEEPTVNLSIAVPFTPTVGSRINFDEFNSEHLTPSELLAKKLTFTTPDKSTHRPISGATPKRKFRNPLTAISEEENNVSIGEELDCYQLELENSINEAKLARPGEPRALSAFFDKPILEEPEDEEIAETEASTMSEPKEQTKIDSLIDDIDEEIDFRKPAPFVRNFKKPILKSKSTEEVRVKEISGNNSGVGKMLRSSIRRVMRRAHAYTDNEKEKSTNENDIDKPKHESLMQTIRSSIRRKFKTTHSNEPHPDDEEKETESQLDVSIIDSEPRKVFKVIPNVSENNFHRQRSMRNKILKSVLKKQTEEYEL